MLEKTEGATRETLGTQDTGRRQTQHRGNQRNWKHWVHKTQDEDKHNTWATRETGNIG